MPPCSVCLVQKPYEVFKTKVDIFRPFWRRSVKHAFPELDEMGQWAVTVTFLPPGPTVNYGVLSLEEELGAPQPGPFIQR